MISCLTLDRRAYAPRVENLEIIQQRANRTISLSRSGVLSLSYGYSQQDMSTWFQKFFGIYSFLTTHVLGEKNMLKLLSTLSAESGYLLRKIRESHTLSDIAYYRKSLFNLAVLMTRYTIEMSSDDCGGLDDYNEYFSKLRKVFNIREQRVELREEIHDVLTLVESTYHEGQRFFASLAEETEKDIKFIKRQLDRVDKQSSNIFGTFVAILTSISLPFVLMSGIFGMNNEVLISIITYARTYLYKYHFGVHLPYLQVYPS